MQTSLKAMKRIERTERKIKQRQGMLSDFGKQGGILYEKHIAKVNRSLGYMRDGNVSHYVAVGFGEKTNNRGNYGKKYNPSIRDQKSNIVAQQQIQELNNSN